MSEVDTIRVAHWRIRLSSILRRRIKPAVWALPGAAFVAVVTVVVYGNWAGAPSDATRGFVLGIPIGVVALCVISPFAWRVPHVVHGVMLTAALVCIGMVIGKLAYAAENDLAAVSYFSMESIQRWFVELVLITGVSAATFLLRASSVVHIPRPEAITVGRPSRAEHSVAALRVRRPEPAVMVSSSSGAGPPPASRGITIGSVLNTECPFDLVPVRPDIDDLILCPTCSAAHHRDCWEQNDGRCAILHS